MDTLGEKLSTFFGVAARGQTYLNTLYLLISFPLGIFYFVFLVTGLSVGLSLLIIWVGLLVLGVVFAAWLGLLAFERQMAITMLKEDIAPMLQQDVSRLNLWQKFLVAVRSPATWKGLAYLFGKFPLGIVSFVLVITLLATSAGLIAAPFYYQYLQPQFFTTYNGTAYVPLWVVDTPVEAALACLLGIVLAAASMHLFNGLAWVSGKFARVMLGSAPSENAQPPAATILAPLEDPSI